MKNTAALFLIGFSTMLCAQHISSDSVLGVNELATVLKPETKAEFSDENNITDKQLAAYFRRKFTERFFYDYRTVDNRLALYNEKYHNFEEHKSRAQDHISKFADSTQWVLPFNYLNGDKVNAYALRHLARQHKMADIILTYFNEDRDPKHIQYFETQMRSLNTALESGAYEKIEDGNGVYEVFRSGYRILNWLWIHNLILNEAEYSDRDQLTTIATLLQHGQHLYERNQEFQPGNHQTRGMSALAMLSILLRDFEGTELWYNTAMQRLSEHLDKEINDDGFQFERSVHYHMSDINNYYYVYQLAKINNITIDTSWKNKLEGLFSTLAKIAYPDKSAPVLQDDTEIPWAETNDISKVMTLGYLLFENPEFGYFASDNVDDRMYWFLNQNQLHLLQNIERKKPTYGSLALTDTHYYVMREGWNANDKMMMISAGLDEDKPDHQHGDMLGIQAMANGHAILPNYQVRYSLKDFELFKNSMVKNVALVDNELQGKQWTSNKGGSGFGKFGNLPKPTVINWTTHKDYDLFIGKHDGFDNVGVSYSRQVISVKNDFWIVKDNFSSDQEHEYKQVWQGHYTNENGSNLLRATAPDASGHDILQLYATDTVITSGSRGKNWSQVSKLNEKNFSFLTLIYPYKGYDNRIDETSETLNLNEWNINASLSKIQNAGYTIISKENTAYFFNANNILFKELSVRTSKNADFIIQKVGNTYRITSTSADENSFTVSKLKSPEETKTLLPGETWEL
ncbi:MAG TPA: heparinase [Maribacter sp.]|uniref:heparinase II/III family protein n=1 Tax=unclassified Maribacter TaxID=2615042 RepID=UPI000ED17152|nr:MULTISPECIES: heparinase II/III family protein [unclassified Maribacter]HAF78586.1 heparinase [Maribacter sp.]HAI40526.1 heparinase [Maribacter sp.]|tara:strand:+ start:39100 stop:41325 length:2226 start_codon:yes stop_codon:yes gene_type:complete